MTTKISGDNISAIANTGINWNAVTVADGSTQLNAIVGNGYFLDTNAGVIEVFLPSSPSRGDTVILADYSGTFGTNKVIVNTGGALIDSTQGGPTPGNEFQITTNNAIVELVYVDADKGWLVKDNTAPSALSTITAVGGGYDSVSYISATGGTITTSGDFKIHTFTGDGCFVVSSIGAGPGPSVVDYLVVGGGGSGGSALNNGGNSGAAGGGAGGFRESKSGCSGCWTASPLVTPTGITVTATTYPITVGAGGTGARGCNPGSPDGSNGSNSVFSTITSAGGGRGATAGYGTNCGGSGGSGGGGSTPSNVGGSGNTPPVSPPQGNNGGAAGADSQLSNGGGGGGAGEAGDNGATIPSGTPGPGWPRGGDGAGTGFNPSCSVGTPGPNGALRYFAGGGSGGTERDVGPGGNQNIPGGVGGGGNGSNRLGAPSGTANTGGGGGGGGGDTPTEGGGNGGKGIVLIRYKFQN